MEGKPDIPEGSPDHARTTQVPTRDPRTSNPAGHRRARKDPDTARGAINRIAEQLGIHREALRGWVRTAEADAVPAEPVDVAARLTALEKENRELRRTNEILKSAAAFFAAEYDRH